MKTRTGLSSARMMRTGWVLGVFAVGACSAKLTLSGPYDTSGAGATGGEAGAGGTNTTGGSAGMGGSAGHQGGCRDDIDCVGNPDGSMCDFQTGSCVECLPLAPPEDDCGQGSFCNPVSHVCEVGCTQGSDCMPGQTCDELGYRCLGCVTDTDCNAGSICISNVCSPGCSGLQPCSAGKSCCAGNCYDFSNDEDNCGFCKNECEAPPNGTALCFNGTCTLDMCKPAFADCNQDPGDGCEWNLLQDGPCTCLPGQKRPCYQGAPGTNNIGVCKSGTQTCVEDGTGWGLCLGQVLPHYEICGNNLDDDCNGIVDDNTDLDGDGWTSCGGDCCDAPGPGCSIPRDINPGAFEVQGDNVDNDCNAQSLDTVLELCSTSEKFTGVTGFDMARAMDLCQLTTETPPLIAKRWGLISADLLLSDGSTPNTSQLTNIRDKQTAIMTRYGANVVPLKGGTFAGMSTGVMRDQNDLGYAGTSTTIGTTSQPPLSYLMQHGLSLPNSQGCTGGCESGSGARDPVNLRLRIRTPTNAKSFTYSFRFFSAEYTLQCSRYNDFFLGLYTSGWMANPADPTEKPLPLDKNVAVDCSVTPCNPISVNNGFFDVCAPIGCNVCPAGVGDLEGTGLEVGNQGGGTKWLFNDVPTTPGEIITLELMVFDVEDFLGNSMTLLDNWTWNTRVRQGVRE
jgi:Putative metal-binding motif